MLYQLIAFVFLSSNLIQAHPTRSKCEDIQIPITISSPRFNITTSIENDWDAVALTFNLSRRDSVPLPISGALSDPVTSTYTIGATLCGGGSSLLVLTHGIIESKKYWSPDLENSSAYNFISAALNAGYSVLSYDRIGVGTSSPVDSHHDAQFQVETQVLNALTTHARHATNATKTALIGHSYGAYLSAASANLTSVDAVVLSGFSGSFANFAPFVAGASWRVAKLQDPERWGHLDAGYLVSADVFAETYVYFAAPYFEQRVAEWSYAVSGEPFAVGELPSLLATYDNFDNVTAPVLIVQGQFDVSACGGDCVGLLGEARKLFGRARLVETVEDLPAGHNLNLHKVAPKAFQMIFDFLAAQGV
ncbi:alpha/beta-hydrolase [Polyplosphaeria fusca]|uniref:Alpha/beta-hydrolase n=1 Tax=Polyplosphaeria fusca TaxID=682080 RepID=A0A9P4UY43_9PLEO|nr:alpha/beta-hydrolase [Polyplosphaeria fusca]